MVFIIYSTDDYIWNDPAIIHLNYQSLQKYFQTIVSSLIHMKSFELYVHEVTPIELDILSNGLFSPLVSLFLLF